MKEIEKVAAKQPELAELFADILALHFRWEAQPPTERQLVGQVSKLIEEHVAEHAEKKKK